MASRKYSYYNKGNKIGLVEQSPTGSGGRLAVAHCTLGGYTTQDTCEAAGGQWIPGSSDSLENYGQYVSPIDSVANGLEIEYSYSPIYKNPANQSLQRNRFFVNGWTILSGYLAFARSHLTTNANWTASPYAAAADDEYILVEGSSRWSGIHKVQTAYANGFLKTYTKVNESLPIVIGSSNIDIYGEGTGGASSTQTRIIANDSSNIWLNAQFSVGDFIFVANSAAVINNGMWEVSGVQDDSSAESSSGIYVTNKYFCYDGDNTLSTEGIDTTPDTTLATDESVNIYLMYRDFCTIQADVSIMQDESFELDLSHQQAQAVIYFMKAKMMEDMGEIERREYFMREFKRALEKASSDRKHGTYRVIGHGMTR